MTRTHEPRGSRLLSLRSSSMVSLGLLVALLTSPAHAADKPEAADEAPDSLEESHEQKRRDDLYERGRSAYAAGDFVGAIDPWQELYETVPLLNRVHLFNPLGRAHWEAYQTDRDEEHLVQAKAMFERNLEATYGDDQSRRDTREVLDEVDAELERLEDEREKKKREDAENEAIAKERRRRERQEQQEQRARLEREKAERRVRLERERLRRRFLARATVGGSLAGIGVLSSATAVVGLALGAKVDRDGTDLMADPDARPEEFQDLLTRGRVYNRLAIATGVLGGALVLSGATVVIVAAVQLRRAKEEVETSARVRVVPGLAGLEVRF